MNALYWLAVFGAVLFNLIFVGGLLSLFYLQKHGTILEQTMIRLQGGPLGCIKWSFLVLGIACLIVVFNL